jgi:hypothetical protein
LMDVTGVNIPVLGSYAMEDAATLLHALRSYDSHERAEELGGWLAGRDATERAQEIADVLMQVSPLSRAVGLTLLIAELGAPGREVLDTLSGVPRLGALVNLRLADRGELIDFTPVAEDIGWVLVDTAAVTLEIPGRPEDQIAVVSGDLPPEDHAEMIHAMALSDHPWTEDVLRLLIGHHHDRRVVAAARTTLRRFRGEPAEPPGARGRKAKKPKKSAQKKRR